MDCLSFFHASLPWGQEIYDYLDLGYDYQTYGDLYHLCVHQESVIS